MDNAGREWGYWFASHLGEPKSPQAAGSYGRVYFPRHPPSLDAMQGGERAVRDGEGLAFKHVAYSKTRGVHYSLLREVHALQLLARW